MRIAVLSGKGGTGKTFVSVNLAAAAGRSKYVDCDVEEPNGHLFFRPEVRERKEVTVSLPVPDSEKCTGCRKCVEFCRFNALAYIKKVFVFEDVCHSCGGCALICPENAIREEERCIGSITKGRSGDVDVFTGMLSTGELSGTPVIEELLEEAGGDGLTVTDCPPGSACIVMDSIKDADYCIIVAEPTIFGRHNLEMVDELVRLLDKPYGVVLNKCMGDDNPSGDFCRREGIEILESIPFDRDLGRMNSDGKIAVREDERYMRLFRDILCKVEGGDPS